MHLLDDRYFNKFTTIFFSIMALISIIINVYLFTSSLRHSPCPPCVPTADVMAESEEVRAMCRRDFPLNKEETEETCGKIPPCKAVDAYSIPYDIYTGYNPLATYKTKKILRLNEITNHPQSTTDLMEMCVKPCTMDKDCVGIVYDTSWGSESCYKLTNEIIESIPDGSPKLDPYFSTFIKQQWDPTVQKYARREVTKFGFGKKMGWFHTLEASPFCNAIRNGCMKGTEDDLEKCNLDEEDNMKTLWIPQEVQSMYYCDCSTYSDTSKS